MPRGSALAACSGRNLRVHVITYNRPAHCYRLLLDVMRCFPEGTKIRVFDDCSTASYGELFSDSYLTSDLFDFRYWRSRRNHGLRGYWQLVDSTHRMLLEDDDFEYVFQFDDDFRLCDRFLERMAALWDELEDPQAVGVNVLNDGRRVCWTGVEPQPATDGLEKVGWLDGGFLVNRTYFEALDYQAFRVPQAWWDAKRGTSSGAYRYISKYLFDNDYGMYRTRRSHVVHADGRKSEMHTKHRTAHPLITKDFIDGEDAARRLEAEAR